MDGATTTAVSLAELAAKGAAVLAAAPAPARATTAAGVVVRRRVQELLGGDEPRANRRLVKSSKVKAVGGAAQSAKRPEEVPGAQGLVGGFDPKNTDELLTCCVCPATGKLTCAVFATDDPFDRAHNVKGADVLLPAAVMRKDGTVGKPLAGSKPRKYPRAVMVSRTVTQRKDYRIRPGKGGEPPIRCLHQRVEWVSQDSMFDAAYDRVAGLTRELGGAPSGGLGIMSRATIGIVREHAMAGFEAREGRQTLMRRLNEDHTGDGAEVDIEAEALKVAAIVLSAPAGTVIGMTEFADVPSSKVRELRQQLGRDSRVRLEKRSGSNGRAVWSVRPA